MKQIPVAMQAALDSRATKHCYCWSIHLRNSTVLGFTDHDRDLVFDAITFKASTGLDASAISHSRNLSVDDMDAIGRLSDESIQAGDIAAGLYDGAIVTIYKVDWSNVDNRVILMRGPIGKIDRGEIGYKAQVKSLAAYAAQRIGRTYASKCRWNLGEGICGQGVNLETASYRDVGLVVSAATTNRAFVTTTAAALSRSSDFYMNGRVVWTSGANTGYAMWVRFNTITSTKAVFELFDSMPNDIQPGDQFTAYAGCQKTIEVCKAKFNNVINYGGFPHIPGPDFVLNYAEKDAKNDGGSLFKS